MCGGQTNVLVSGYNTQGMASLWPKTELSDTPVKKIKSLKTNREEGRCTVTETLRRVGTKRDIEQCPKTIYSHKSNGEHERTALQPKKT